jgi:hypothetical protein
MRVQPGNYDWLNQLLGSDYASSMGEVPLYHLQSVQLSQYGIWEHGQSSGVGTFEEGGPSQPPTQNPIFQIEDPTQATTEITVRRHRRNVRARQAYTPSAYKGHGRGRG